MYNEADKSNAILHTKRLQKSNDGYIAYKKLQKSNDDLISCYDFKIFVIGWRKLLCFSIFRTNFIPDHSIVL